MAVPDKRMQFPILIGDIGGTNARFQILIDAFAEPKEFPHLRTADFDTIEEAIQFGVLDKTSLTPRTAVLAAAGPIDRNGLELTNNSWFINPPKLMQQLVIDEMILLNDFEAQALAASSFKPDEIVAIGNGIAHEHASRVVVGPGTGLGVAGLVHARNIWIPVPGEGGHVDMGPQTAEDRKIWQHLKDRNGRISAEALVSGRGILNICKAVALSEYLDHNFTSQEEVTAAALAGADPLAIRSVELFCTYLGRIAGDLALTFLARGGVYIAGGIGRQIEQFLVNGHFREAFEQKSPHRELLQSIPTYLIVHDHAALAGLAAYARDPSRFGVETRHRRWQSANVG